ncbi:CAP-associated domain-containing protein [Pseudoneobacillus rhizosphaerae]|uniref:Serine protease n=1 Tax=Pseudoneobacillus rhizosphaerae TaxID=2880968 RepID=A0A9C7L926_9BACI|nr:CAP-associated domain-containing protein [Pseudoneobacillus rhizosphaerae]CAG9607591.1 hypothetical protein NEOCIP111885_01283 [Pseudoneobacillus rhizosphaerae]
MFNLLKLILYILLIYFSWPIVQNQIDAPSLSKTVEEFQGTLNTIQNNQDVRAHLSTLNENLQIFWDQLGLLVEDSPHPLSEKPLDEIKLEIPDQLLSINNIELGHPKDDIEKKLGTPQRVSLNEYGTFWATYHNNYHHFFMVLYDKNNNAAGLYTNQNLIASTTGLKFGSSKADVRLNLGNPLTKIQKGMTFYQLQEKSDFDVFLHDNVYITIFYDKHKNDTVTSIQLIHKDIEQNKADIYPKVSADLKEGFEYQLFDLTNASRVNHQLPILTWDEHVRETARKHSTDMALNQYFSHINLDGKSPFDRLKEDQISFHTAGENLAYGQFSSIFAHEGLMNSMGHRKNILQKDYEYLGVGVAFNEASQPYFTQNFFAN